MSDLIFVAILIWCVVLMISRRNQAATNPLASQRMLSRSDKIQIWIISLLNPLLGGGILYYGWRRPLPIMAKQANRISFIAFFIELGILAASFVLYSVFGGAS